MCAVVGAFDERSDRSSRASSIACSGRFGGVDAVLSLAKSISIRFRSSGHSGKKRPGSSESLTNGAAPAVSKIIDDDDVAWSDEDLVGVFGGRFGH